jgi:hypothetical protein
MTRVVALLLLCICGLSSLVACGGPQPHGEPQVEHTRADCSGCHEREYRSAPLHVDAKPTRCAVCHSETSWEASELNHAWALTGAHAKADCASCHKGWSPQYEHTENTCSGCHRDAFEKDGAGHHEVALVSSNCQDCHNTQSWRPATERRRTLLQLSAATTAATQGHAAPAQAAAASAGNPANGAAVAPSAKAPAQRADAVSAPAPQAEVGAATPSEPATAPGLGRAAKSPAGKRARRGDAKRKRTLAAAQPRTQPTAADRPDTSKSNGEPNATPNSRVKQPAAAAANERSR